MKKRGNMIRRELAVGHNKSNIRPPTPDIQPLTSAIRPLPSILLLLFLLSVVSAIDFASVGDIYTNFRWDDLKNITASWDEYQGNLFYNNGNVGIGTITPNSKLQITGNVSIGGILYMGNNKITNLANGTTATDAVTYSQLQAVNISATAAETDPKWTGNWTNVAFKNAANTFTENIVLNKNLTVDTNTLFVNSNTDRVGIGTTTPQALLHGLSGVADFRFSTGASSLTPTISVINTNTGGKATALVAGVSGSVFAFDSSGYFDIMSESKDKFTSNSIGNGVRLFTILPSGNIGIGTTTPNSKLQIAGNASIGGILYMNNNVITGLSNATAATDAVTKAQLDAVSSVVTGDFLPYSGATKNLTLGTFNISGNLGSFNKLRIANNEWISGVDSSGTGVVNMFKVNPNNEIDVGGTLNIGTLSFSEDSGLVTAMDMPVSSSASVGTPEGYVFRVDSDNILSVYSESDGSGGVTNKRVGIGTISPTSTLDVNGTATIQGNLTITGNNLYGSGDVNFFETSGYATSKTVSGISSAGTISYANIAIGASQVTSGTLAVARGGTGATTFTAGRILFGAGTSAIDTNSDLFWDNTNKRLGIGTTTPQKKFHVNGTKGGLLIDVDNAGTNHPVINTTSGNITISSAGGSVIIKLG